MNASTRRTIDRLEAQFEHFHSLVDGSELLVQRISDWSIAQHLDHLMKADRSIFARIEDPTEETLPPLSQSGRLVLWSGWIPRGKGRAPKIAYPDTPGSDELTRDIHSVREIFKASLDPRERLTDPRRVAKHHIFGGMSAAQWLRFVEVHHHHHLKIVRDILRADPA